MTLNRSIVGLLMVFLIIAFIAGCNVTPDGGDSGDNGDSGDAGDGGDGGAIIIDHNCNDLDSIPSQYIEAVKYL
jgi:hypothetical protein